MGSKLSFQIPERFGGVELLLNGWTDSGFMEP